MIETTEILEGTIENNQTLEGEVNNSSSSDYKLPIASEKVLGGIKVGKNLTIEADGTLNAQAGGSGEAATSKLSKVLFDNAEGEVQEVILNDELANFKYVDIYYSYLGNTWGYDNTRIYEPNGKLTNLTIDVLNNEKIYTTTSTWSLNGNTITKIKAERFRFGVTPDITRAQNTEDICIHRVVGHYDENVVIIGDVTIIEEKDPTVPQHVKNITQEDINKWNGGTGGTGDSSNLKYNYVVDGVRLYVDGVNGSDNNDGSSSKPFKTIERFFDEANKLNNGRNDIRCYIVRSGIYTISKHSINHLTIHITGSVDGVILNFTTDRDVKFYECHTNLNNVTIRCPNATELAFDGGSVALTKCTFEKAVTCYSCSGYFETVTLPNLIANYSNLSLHIINITNTSTNAHAYRFESCVVRMYGSCQNAPLSSTPTNTPAFICSNNSFIYCAITLRIQSPTYKYGFYGDGNFVATNETYYNYWVNRTDLGIGFKDVPSMFINTSKNIKTSELGSGGGTAYEPKQYDLTQYVYKDVTNIDFTRTRCINKFDRVVIDFVIRCDIVAETDTILFELPEELTSVQSVDFLCVSTGSEINYGFGWINKGKYICVRMPKDISSSVDYLRACIVYDL